LLLPIEELSHILYQVLIKTKMNNFVFKLSQFVLSIEQLPELSLQMMILHDNVFQICLFLSELLAEIFIVMLSAY
jgi:hypothetical protein